MTHANWIIKVIIIWQTEDWRENKLLRFLSRLHEITWSESFLWRFLFFNQSILIYKLVLLGLFIIICILTVLLEFYLKFLISFFILSLLLFNLLVTVLRKFLIYLFRKNLVIHHIFRLMIIFIQIIWRKYLFRDLI